MALAGLGLGLAIPLPLYMLRAMGAGDVKLMAMVGAFLGPRAIVGAILVILVVGGVLSLLVTLRNGSLHQLMDNVRNMLMASFFKLMLREMPTLDAAPVSAGKMPFGIAIVVGTFAFIGLARWGNYMDLFRIY
jgi:prepilin peptidase CpaA